MRTVKWIDVKPEILQTKTEDAEKQTVPAPEIQSTPRPTKRKVVETEVEPAYTAITGANSEVELLFSAIADYAKYELNTNKVFFKDTLMFQTIMYRYVHLNFKLSYARMFLLFYKCYALVELEFFLISSDFSSLKDTNTIYNTSSMKISKACEFFFYLIHSHSRVLESNPFFSKQNI